VSIWHDFCHVKLKSCKLDTTSVLLYRSRANLTRSQLWLIGTNFAYEVVPNWHDLPKFVIFFKQTHFNKKKKNNSYRVEKNLILPIPTIRSFLFRMLIAKCKNDNKALQNNMIISIFCAFLSCGLQR